MLLRYSSDIPSLAAGQRMTAVHLFLSLPEHLYEVLCLLLICASVRHLLSSGMFLFLVTSRHVTSCLARHRLAASTCAIFAGESWALLCQQHWLKSHLFPTAALCFYFSTVDETTVPLMFCVGIDNSAVWRLRNWSSRALSAPCISCPFDILPHTHLFAVCQFLNYLNIFIQNCHYKLRVSLVCVAVEVPLSVCLFVHMLFCPCQSVCCVHFMFVSFFALSLFSTLSLLLIRKIH